MNASKTLTSLIAAAAIVGSVGFAYAQTAANPDASSATPAPMAPMPGMTNAPATSAAPTDSGTSSEPAPKADRN